VVVIVRRAILFAGYFILQFSGYSYAQCTSASGSTVAFTDMTPPLTGYYVVTAVNASGAESGFSNELCVQPGADSTVLVANFLNGNKTVLNSRVYLWNPSASAGSVTVRVFTLPQTGDSLLLGTADLGMLQASSARNIKLAEDVLAPLGILLLYTDNGGNLTLEFTIGASNVRGSGQVFSSDLAFGTYPLQEVLSTSNVDPTVLAAHFMNGNTGFVNSRIYLWNPSASAGEVAVGVFTLPLAGSTPQELTGTPLNLGSLGAGSARNIKLVEDILIPLGLGVPYTNDGGNLALELTIQAPNVKGAAQVFSSDMAFGTYLLR
jgi:hypothetical protein